MSHRASFHQRAVTILTLITFLAPLAPRPARADSATASHTGNFSSEVTAGQSDLGMPEGDAEAGVSALVNAKVDPSTGALSASIPFALPKARGSVQPSLALNYSSVGGVGIGGSGWSLALPSIERRNPSGGPHFENDPHPGGRINPALQDAFTFGGEELIPVCFLPDDLSANCLQNGDNRTAAEVLPTWVTNGWHYYRLAHETGANLRFFWSPDHLLWIVQAPDGSTQEYGVPQDDTSDAGAIDVDERASAGRWAKAVFRWNLSRQYDAQRIGTSRHPTNVIQYKWEKIEAPDGPNVATTPIGYLVDVFDTPKVGDVAPAPGTFAHHAHLSYEIGGATALVQVWSPVWRARPAFLLTGVDVTSQTFKGAPTREQIRRYHLTYGGTTNRLAAVQVEGWCPPPAAAPSEDKNTFLLAPHVPNVFACPTLSPTTFTYTPLLAPVVSAVGPKVLAQNLPTITDLNADGMPDLVTPGGQSLPYVNATYNLNSAGTTLNDWSKTVTLPNAPGLPYLSPTDDGYNAGAFTNGSILDIFYMGGFEPNHDYATTRTANMYTLKPANGSWAWSQQTLPNVTWAQRLAANPPDKDRLRYLYRYSDADIDGDGLVDMVTGMFVTLPDASSSQQVEPIPFEMNVAFSTRAADGTVSPFVVPSDWSTPNGCIGSATSSSTSTGKNNVGVIFGQHSSDENDDTAPPNPINTLADMNGDGLVDWIRIDPVADPRHAALSFGQGTGAFGQCDPLLPTCTCADYRSMVVDGPNVDMTYAHIHDIDGDGRADLLIPTDSGFDVYVNKRGYGFELTPTSVNVLGALGWTHAFWPPGSTSYVFSDMDGSGVDDVVLVNKSDQKGHLLSSGTPAPVGYVSFAPTVRPGLLQTIESGTGLMTSVGYATLPALSRAARAASQSWTRESPQPLSVVTYMTVSDAPALEPVSPQQTTSYTYHDPAYDTRDRAFLGFGSVETTKTGVDGDPTSHETTYYFHGLCDGAANPCPQTVDYPNRAVRSLPVVTQVDDGRVAASSDHVGVRLSTVHHAYEVRKTYRGLDGRFVRRIAEVATDTYLSDTPAATNLTTATPVTDVVLDGQAITQVPLTVPPAAAHLLRTRIVDWWGMSGETLDYGQVDKTRTSVDGILADRVESAPIALDTVDNWIWRTKTATDGSADTYGTFTNDGQYATFPRAVTSSYDARGNLLTQSTFLQGTSSLQRRHETPGKNPAPVPTSSGGTVVLVSMQYKTDGTGNVWRIQQPSTNVCVDYSYDGLYSQLATEVDHYVNGCGSAKVATIGWDFQRGMGRPIKITSPGNMVSIVNPDAFGRPLSMALPDQSASGSTAPTSVTVEYLDKESPRKVHVTASTDSGKREAWTYVDGAGEAILSVAPADTTAGDAASWVASGLAKRSARGHVVRAYEPTFQPDPKAIPLNQSGPSRTARYDAFGRVVQAFDLDGVQILQRTYRALVTVTQDGEQLKSSGPRAGLSTQVTRDGHGRTTGTQMFGNGGSSWTTYEHLPSGEVWRIVRGGSDAKGTMPTYTRWMRFDTMGRMVVNAESNTSANFTTDPNLVQTMQSWRYLYDDAGRVVATSDARGCGENFAYDGLGRLVSEDYSPCLASQLDYTPVQADGKTGTEAYYAYDVPTGTLALGRLTDVYDRAQHTHYDFDARARTTRITRQLAKPTGASPALSDRYASTAYHVDMTYDDMDRLKSQTTGADVSELQGKLQATTSALQLHYSARGVLSSVDGAYGPLVTSATFGADGTPQTQVYADAAHTTITSRYDGRKRLLQLAIAPSSITVPACTASTNPSTFANDCVTYDDANNPVQILDRRADGDWPATAAPVSRSIGYDDFYRVTSVSYTYDKGLSTYAPPGPAASSTVNPVPRVTPAARIGSETFSYDPFGSLMQSGDDQGLFFDRSLGTVINGPQNGGNFQLNSASLWTGKGTGNLFAYYDAAGQLVGTSVYRDGTCDTGLCSQIYRYEWDEVGHLAHALRYDIATPTTIQPPKLPPIPPPKPPPCQITAAADLLHHPDGTTCQVIAESTIAGAPTSNAVVSPNAVPVRHDLYVYPAVPNVAAAIDMRASYDASGARVLRSYAGAGTQKPTYSADIFSSLRFKHAEWDNAKADYSRTRDTEKVYLAVGGSALGRVVFVATGATTGQQHVLFEMVDSLGSTSATVDRETGALVERKTYTAYGQIESDYHADAWRDFREDYEFAGAEQDYELGLSYMGARYFSPNLGRWISADPLAIHAAGADLNPYAYVHGRVMSATDPSGLGEGDDDGESSTSPTEEEKLASKPCTEKGCNPEVLPDDVVPPGQKRSSVGPPTPPAPLSSGNPSQASSGSSAVAPTDTGCKSQSCHTEVDPDPWTKQDSRKVGNAPIVAILMIPMYALGPVNTANAVTSPHQRAIPSTTKRDLLIWAATTVALGAVAKVVTGPVAGVAAGDAGSFASLDARAVVGDELTPHHMPQAALGFTSRDEGGALVMAAKEHAKTRTYGALGRITAREEANMSFRSVLARDMRDVRQIVGPRYDNGLREMLKYYYDNFPEHMQR